MSDVRAVFKNIDEPASYSGAANIARSTGRKYSNVRKALAEEIGHSLHWPRRYKFPRLKTVPLEGFFTNLQADLADFQDLAKENNGYRYCLLGVDILSRRFFAVPVKSKKSDDMCAAFDQLLTQMPKKPQIIFTDGGMEFCSRQMNAWYRSKLIQKHAGMSPQIKASVAERGKFFRSFRRASRSFRRASRRGARTLRNRPLSLTPSRFAVRKGEKKRGSKCLL